MTCLLVLLFPEFAQNILEYFGTPRSRDINLIEFLFYQGHKNRTNQASGFSG